jgi:conjugative relaxase-like TrwC/TraI family protein
MLGIHGVRRDAADYYLSDLGRELPTESAPVRWAGAAAAGLGLEGPIGESGFRRLLEGRHPVTDQPMGSRSTRVAAFDLTFSAPKSASVLFALGGEEVARHVVGAHAEAVAGALRYLEEHGVTAVRRSQAERVVLPTTGVVAARFTHAVNRNGDPHLHSHVVMANLVHGADGRWSACDRRGLDAHRAAASAVYEAHLRDAVSTAVGLSWSLRPGRPSEIAGVAPALLGEFSSRGADIRRHMHELGARPGRGGRVAWAVTRPPKGEAPPYGLLVAEWGRRARAAGGEMELTRWPARTRPSLDEHCYAAVISLTPHGGVHRRDVVAAFGVAARDGIAADSLQHLVSVWVPPGPVGVSEPLRARRSVVPGNHLLHALGPRPLDPGDHDAWVAAARSIDAYRSRWGLERSPEPLGAAPRPASLPAAQLADHLRVTRLVRSTRVRLGRREPMEVALGIER